MFKYLGQHIFDFVSKFRNDVYFQNLEELDQNFSIVVGPDGKLSKSKSPAEKSIIEVRNDEGSVIPAGAPLYSKGEIGGSDRIKVGICDASDPAKMPCIGIAQVEMNTSDTKDNFAITQGVYNTNISGFTGLSEGDTLYVNGGSAPYLVSTKPSNGNYIQNVGIVLKTNGTICQGLLVSAIGRTNDVPWPLYVDVPNSRVGIGTTSPSSALQVVGDGQGDGILVSNVDGYNVGRIYNNNSNAFPVGNLTLSYGNTTPAFINAESNGISIRGGATDTAGNNIKFRLYTSEKMRLTPTGLGIGTTSPAGTLHVVGTSGGAGEIYISDVDNGVGSSDGLLISKSGTNAFIYNRDNGQISFGTNNVSNNLVITNTGNVGIGTTSPSWKLDVNGGTENILASFSSTDQTAQLRIVDSSNTPFYFGVIGTGAYISPTGGTPADGISIRNTGDIGIGQGFPTHKLDVKGDISADEFLQAPSGIPRANLGDPTVTEMALFESQMSCKTDLSDDYTDLTKVTFWQQPNEGDAWSQVTVSDDNKKKFLRTNNSSIVIPNGTYRYRVEFEPKSYRSAQAFYCYHSYRGNAFAVHVWKRRCSDNQWFQHTDSDVEVGKWPGHLYLPMDAIFWHPTDTTSTYRYNLIRIEFIPNWSASNTYNIDLFGGQLWGGYPAGRRTPHTYNHDGQLTLPANLIVPDDLIVNSGNVGIGTTSPSGALHVNQGTGDAVTSLYTSTYGTVTIARNHSTNPYIQTSFVSGQSALSFYQNSNLYTKISVGDSYFNGGNVGIGTTSPNHLLDVEAAGASARIYNLTSDGVTDFYLSTVGTTGLSRLLFGDTANSAIGKIIYRNSSDSMAFETNATEAMRITSDGNVGIGTTAPTAELHVETSNQSDVLLKSTSSSSVFTADGFVNSVFAMKENGTLKSEFFYDSINNQMKIRTSSAESLSLGVNNGQNIFIRGSDGNVGIGTTSPSVPLEVKKGDTSQIISDRAGNGTNIVLKRSGVTRGVLATNDVSGKEFEL